MNRKRCPLLVQCDHQILPNKSYMLECLGEKCVAYREEDDYCRRFLNYAIDPSYQLNNCWCTRCVHARNKKYDDIVPISYYCSKRGNRVPAYHPTVNCEEYKEKTDASEDSKKN